jgi:hypothetical protein
MMRLDSFSRSAGFAALAALGWIPWLLVSAPLVGGAAARAVYLVTVTALYAGGLATGVPRRALVTCAVALGGLVLACLAPGTSALCVGLAGVLGTVRSAFLRRTDAVRAVAIEGVLLVGGLVFARFLAGGTVTGIAMALWGFLLVQSCFFLLGGVRVRFPDPHRGDPFDEAVARATDVLERPLV